jgi:hypothetical protein
MDVEVRGLALEYTLGSSTVFYSVRWPYHYRRDGYIRSQRYPEPLFP